MTERGKTFIGGILLFSAPLLLSISRLTNTEFVLYMGLLFFWIGYESMLPNYINGNQHRFSKFLPAIPFLLGLSIASRFGSTKLVYSIIAVIFIMSGFTIRIVSIRTLGIYFTDKVHVLQQQKVVSAGIYRYLRHPSYTGFLLIYTGFPLLLGSWTGAIISLSGTFVALMYRIHIEEKAMLNHFGRDYANYMKKTKRLIPFVF